MKQLLLVVMLLNLAYAGSAKLLVAANAKFFFTKVVEAYGAKYPGDVIEVEYGPSGIFTEQILGGKEYDVFLAANRAYAQKVYDAKKASSEPKLYTTGSLIILIAKHEGLKEKKIHILEDPSIREITIANKKNAPYGMAAIEALKNAGIYDKLEAKLVYSTDASDIIGDVLYYGHAGILPKSAVQYLPRGYNVHGENWLEIDQSLYSPIEQYFVYSHTAEGAVTPKRFMEFVLSKEGQAIFKEYGYQ